MADRTARSIVINAPADAVMAVIADFARYPDWVAAAKSAQVLTIGSDGKPAVVRFNLDAGMLREEFDLGYQWSADGHEVKWELVRSELQRAQHGTYSLDPQADGSTLVKYELSVDLNVPMIGQFKRKAEKIITDTALDELKKRVEA